MKKIIPFTNDIKFNTKIFEITSISLEHNLKTESNNTITGEFIVSGDYKMNDSSINTEPFIHGLPFDITLDDKYDMENLKIDIDDFKFEIINEEILRVNIDVLIEGNILVELEEEKIEPSVVIDSRKEEEIKENLIDIGFTEEELEDREVDSMNEEMIEDLFEETDEEIKEVYSPNDNIVEPMKSVFNSLSSETEKYVTYYVHIVRENDNIDSICMKYGVSTEELKEYNNIEQITLGSKIIVPYTKNETV